MNNSGVPFETVGFGGEYRAPYACDPQNSRGRLISEPASPTRTPSQRDRDRVVHSTAFRRLKHKTQVFIYHEGDHFRTRLTHTIEVAQVARSIARALRVDEDLAEALALAHDLGHTPFGHAGEDALARSMVDYDGFEHNAQTLRIVTALEKRYATFDGLNLSWETLEGIVKHNGPLLNASGASIGKYADDGLPHAIQVYSKSHDLMLNTYASIEAQSAAIADDIAYNAHDIDDGLREGVFTLDDLSDVPLVGDILKEVRELYPKLNKTRTTHELVRRLITRLIEDVIMTAQSNLAALQPTSADDVRRAGRVMVGFSKDMILAERAIKSFLFEHMYRTPKVLAVRDNAEIIVGNLFDRYLNDPTLMANEWGEPLSDLDVLPRLVCDYVAGMTDRFALQEHHRLFDVTPDLS
ncbi:MAG: deoxyguanosinetriphosphate triphosphohydrolase [Hyphomicrobiales bacterium]